MIDYESLCFVKQWLRDDNTSNVDVRDCRAILVGRSLISLDRMTEHIIS